MYVDLIPSSLNSFILLVRMLNTSIHQDVEMRFPPHLSRHSLRAHIVSTKS
jgi:site-specific recombinase XerC